MSGPTTRQEISRLMNVCVVELTTTPADENFNQQGFAVRVEISYDESGCRSASYWRRTTHAMQWMEHENGKEIRVGALSQLREEVAASILEFGSLGKNRPQCRRPAWLHPRHEVSVDDFVDIFLLQPLVVCRAAARVERTSTRRSGARIDRS